METQEKFLMGALIGSALGATAALMFAPFSGEAMRRRLAKGLNLPASISRSQRAGASAKRKSHTGEMAHYKEERAHANSRVGKKHSPRKKSSK